MKIEKKSYVFGLFILIMSLLSFFLIKTREPIKADNKKYSINIESIDEKGKYPVTLSLSETANTQLKLVYEGINVVTATTLMQGISEEQRESVTIEDTKDASEKIITLKKTVSALKINFLISRLEQSDEGKLTLMDVNNHTLTSATATFVKESAPVTSPFATTATQSFAAFNETLTGPVEATPEEIAAANDAANTRFGFNPLANVKKVSKWTEFESAYNDQTVTKIIMTANITRGSNLDNRQNSLEIDGSGFILNMTNDTLRLAPTPADGIGFFHFHDMTAKNSANEGNGTGANMWGFVSGTNGTRYARNWHYRVGNINTVRVNGERVIRLIRGTRAEITVYGKLNLITTSENFYAGSMIIEDGTNWYGEDTGSNYSVIWFEQNSSGTDTGAAKLFKIGKHAQVILKNSTSGATYPAVYSYYSNLTVGENSIYNSNMTGNSVRFDLAGSQMNVKKGAIVNLLSRGDGSVMQFSANNTSFNLESEGSIYIVGSTTDPIVDITGGSNRTFTLNSPKGFDIRNKNTGNTRNSPAVSTGTVDTNVFTINDSDIDLWALRSELMGPSQQTYAKVANFAVKARGGSENVSTTEAGLTDFVPTQYRRIAGMNSKPEVEWETVTDADKTYKARVKIGLTPAENFDENGNVILQAVYAGNGQANVIYTDTFGNKHSVSTNDKGYAVMTDSTFNIAGKQMKAHAIRGPWVSEVDPETTVLDITPPEPAKIVGGRVTNATKQLIGENAEPNAKIYVDINGVRQPTVGKVNADGTWIYNLLHYLKKDDTVQIFLEDNATEITETLSPAAPATHSANGNINPTVDLNYRDALFKAATKYTVEDVLPDKPLIEKAVVSSGGATTQVGDMLTYTITAKNNKAADYDTLLANTVIKDTLPAGLNLDPATAEIKIDGMAAKSPDDYSYNSDTRLLWVKVGDLATGDSVVITFKAKVASSAVGTIITNTAELIGESPREKTFIAGPNSPDAEHETYSVTSSEAKNPGGTVFGVLELASAPTEVDFGSVKYQGKKTRINAAEHRGADLVVKDSRANKYGWALTAKLTTPMTSTDPDIPAYTLVGALKYVYNNREITLNGGAQEIMIQVANATTTETTYNISDTWSETGDGFKFEASAQDVQALGTYQGEILWELGDTP